MGLIVIRDIANRPARRRHYLSATLTLPAALRRRGYIVLTVLACCWAMITRFDLLAFAAITLLPIRSEICATISF